MNNTLLGANTEIKRGSILMVDLPLNNGSVQGGVRPVVVVSNNKGNKFSPVLVVVPLTSKTKKVMPTHYTVSPSSKNGLSTRSTALCEQILTVGKDTIKGFIGTLEAMDMGQINTKIKTSLALF